MKFRLFLIENYMFEIENFLCRFLTKILHFPLKNLFDVADI